jgi:hypothetical protein
MSEYNPRLVVGSIQLPLTAEQTDDPEEGLVRFRQTSTGYVLEYRKSRLGVWRETKCFVVNPQTLTTKI